MRTTDLTGFLAIEHPTDTPTPFSEAGRGGVPIVRTSVTEPPNATPAAFMGPVDWVTNKLRDVAVLVIVGALAVGLIYLGGKTLLFTAATPSSSPPRE